MYKAYSYALPNHTKELETFPRLPIAVSSLSALCILFDKTLRNQCINKTQERVVHSLF